MSVLLTILMFVTVYVHFRIRCRKMLRILLNVLKVFRSMLLSVARQAVPNPMLL